MPNPPPFCRAGAALAASLSTSLCFALPDPAADGVAPLSPTELSRFSIEELAEIEISSVSRRPEPLSDAAAAVYVIGREDIRRSGATSLPEILRLAPNLQVARLDSSRYAITARGFNGTSANKLQVLIDGRSVYTPLFSGVFWDVQDTLVEDIERVEVVSGPGGTLWGSNAVNGVINIVTRHSRDTAGSLVSLAAGTRERVGALRHGVRLSDKASVRLWARGLGRDESRLAGGSGAHDAWEKGQAGFRFDWQGRRSGFLLEGDLYDGSLERLAAGDTAIAGSHLLGRWSRQTGDGEVRLQAYYDRTRRAVPGSFGETLETWDLDLQQHLRRGERHDIVWGGGYRLMRDRVGNSAVLAFLPAHKDLELAHIFVQDSIALAPRWQLTLGAKLERNSYTGYEWQPNARLAWKPRPQTLWWGAVSRPVRTPSRLDRELFAPGPPAPPLLLAGGPAFRSEKLIAYELGYRAQPAPQLSWSLTAFRHDYQHLRSLEPAGGDAACILVDSRNRIPCLIANEMQGHSYGLETWGSLQVREGWRLAAGYTALRQRLHFAAPSRDQLLRNAGNDPRHQFFLRSSHNFSPRLEADFFLRSIGRLPDPALPAYLAVDARIGWNIDKDMQLALVGNNLFERRHREFATASGSNAIERSFLLRLTWKF